MIGCLWTRVRKQPIIALYFDTGKRGTVPICHNSMRFGVIFHGVGVGDGTPSRPTHLHDQWNVNDMHLQCISNGVARILKKLRTTGSSKGSL